MIITDNEQRALAESLISAVRAIAHGPTTGPTGLELLAIALSGDGSEGSLAQAVRDAGDEIGRGLQAIAEAVVRSFPERACQA